MARLIGSAAAAALLAACAQPAPRSEAFRATGQLIALSGGDGGAANACVTCHGLNGGGNGAGTPRLAGLGQGYLERQLHNYASGLRRHPRMREIALKLSNDDRQRVAAYFDGLALETVAPAEAGTAAGSRPPEGLQRPSGPGLRRGDELVWLRGDPARGLAACATCHGVDGNGASVGNPPLAGQPAAYLAHQLNEWRAGRRRGAGAHVMQPISQRLRQDEIERLSAYAAALPARRREYAAGSRSARRSGSTNGA